MATYKRDSMLNIRVREVLVPASDVLTLFSATVKPVILPPPGEGNMNMVLAATVEMIGGTTDYATGTGSMFLAYKVGGDGDVCSAALLDDLDQMTAASVAVLGTITEIQDMAFADVNNQSVVLTMDTDDCDTGDRNLLVRVMYCVIPLVR